MAKKGAFGAIEIGASPAPLGQVANMSFNDEYAEIDVTVMGSGNAAVIPGSGSQRIEAQVFYEQADAGQVAFLAALGSDAAATLVVYYPEGKVSGKESITGSYYFLQYNSSQAADGAIEVNLVMTGDGNGVTRGTVA